LVEMATTEEIYYTPKHPYTESLYGGDSTRRPGFAYAEGKNLKGSSPVRSTRLRVVLFHPRCPYADNDRCINEVPEFREISKGHFVSCHYAEKISLKGALEHKTTVDFRGVENNQQIDDMRKRRNKIVTNQKKQ